MILKLMLLGLGVLLDPVHKSEIGGYIIFRADCITGESPPIVTGFTKQSAFSILD